MEELQRSVGRIEGKLDLLIERSEADGKRISALEKKHWWTMGASAVLAYVGVHLGK